MKLNRKNKLLLLGIVVILFLCYKLAIAKTIEYYQEYNVQKEVMLNSNGNPLTLNNLLAQEKQIDQWLSKNNYNSDLFQNQLLIELNNYCSVHNLKLIDFKEPHSVIENEMQINSYSFSIEGSYNSTLGLICFIENKSNLGFVKHISTSKNKNYKTNVESIVTTVIIQKNVLTKK